jgi:hypothetical protein
VECRFHFVELQPRKSVWRIFIAGRECTLGALKRAIALRKGMPDECRRTFCRVKFTHASGSRAADGVATRNTAWTAWCSVKLTGEESSSDQFPMTPGELSLSYGRRSVDQFVLVLGSPLGPMTKFYPSPFLSDNCFVVLPVGCPLWWEDCSVTYSAIADWSGHWGPITIHDRLIWDCVPSSSPLTIRRATVEVF